MYETTVRIATGFVNEIRLILIVHRNCKEIESVKNKLTLFHQESKSNIFNDTPKFIIFNESSNSNWNVTGDFSLDGYAKYFYDNKDKINCEMTVDEILELDNFAKITEINMPNF